MMAKVSLSLLLLFITLFSIGIAAVTCIITVHLLAYGVGTGPKSR